jgi:hypothetical protein
LELQLFGQFRSIRQAPAVRHVTKQRFTGWKQGAHGLEPDAN